MCSAVAAGNNGEWTPNLYWVADALTVLGDGEVHWGRAEALAIHAGMRVRFAAALSRLTLQFHADIPKHVCAARARRWEQRECALLQKPRPLGYLDGVAWHVYHFSRLRGFDAQWRSIPAFIGFPRARSRYWKVRSS